MKQIYTIVLLLSFSFSANSQSWTSKSYTSLKLSFPEDSMQKEFVAVPGLLSTYGFYYPNPSGTAAKEILLSFHVMEAPNEWEVANAHELTIEDFESLIFTYDDTKLEEVGNREIAGLKAKYAKTSRPFKESEMTYIFFYEGNAIVIMGTYTTKKEKELLPILRKVLKEIELI